MIELLDLGITISMLFLFSVYIATLCIISYTNIIKFLFNCEQYSIIPASFVIILFDIWNDIVYQKAGSVWLGVIILFLSIIPLSLLWPVTYPVMGYLIMKYKNSQRFANLLSSV